MITWHQIDPDEVVGRDAVIQAPYGIVRGPISALVVDVCDVRLFFFWTAVQVDERRWRQASETLLCFNRYEPITLPVIDPDGRIRFWFNKDGYGNAVILPHGDNLDPYKVPGLASRLDTPRGGEF